MRSEYELATPNYGYEKRQRELAKKRKKEDKLKAKAERKSHGPDGEEIVDGTDADDAADPSLPPPAVSES